MDSFEIKYIKVGKANGVAKKAHFRKMGNLFRVMEICVLLVVVARIFAQLPLAVRGSGEYFKDLKVVLISPRFVFIIGNLIVVILFAKSGQFSAQDSARNNPRNDCFEEFLVQNTHRDEVKYREKRSICEENVVNEGTHTSCKSNSYRRSQSEKFKRVNSDTSCRELRRSATEKCRKSTNSGDKSAKNSFPEDNMSNEEFRCTIEAFIARQQRLRMEEEYSDLKLTHMLA